jgi:hypothetical protein
MFLVKSARRLFPLLNQDRNTSLNTHSEVPTLQVAADPGFAATATSIFMILFSLIQSGMILVARWSRVGDDDASLTRNYHLAISVDRDLPMNVHCDRICGMGESTLEESALP